MADTQIIIEATDTNGNPVNKTIKNINTDVTNAQLATFGTMLNALTDNQYGKTTKITKVHCDVEAGGGDTRPVPTFELVDNSGAEPYPPLNDTQLNITKNNNTSFGLKCNSDGTIYVPALGARIQIFWRDAEDSNGVKGFVVNPGTNFEVGDTFDVVIKTEETENFKAGSVTLHVTVTA